MSSTLVHVGVRATDLAKTIRFWRDGLGLSLVNQRENSYDLSDGYHNFRVFQHNGPARPQHVSGMLDYLHIGVRVPNVKEAAERLLGMGYEIFSDGLNGKVPLDVRTLQEGAFKVEDPDGITVDVTSSDDQWPGVRLR
ncbi:MAG: VOC family protein [Chloroflexi bacterium]|nr:VOC family protein [Chloroflexota bacterium]